MRVFDLPAALAAPTDPGAPHFLASYGAAGPCLLGVLTRARGSTDGSWERHDGGDELLVILRGRAIFTMVLPDGTTEVAEVGPQQALVIPRGAAHTARILDDVQVLFMLPRDGNAEWLDASAGQAAQR